MRAPYNDACVRAPYDDACTLLRTRVMMNVRILLHKCMVLHKSEKDPGAISAQDHFLHHGMLSSH